MKKANRKRELSIILVACGLIVIVSGCKSIDNDFSKLDNSNYCVETEEIPSEEGITTDTLNEDAMNLEANSTNICDFEYISSTYDLSNNRNSFYFDEAERTLPTEEITTIPKLLQTDITTVPTQFSEETTLTKGYETTISDSILIDESISQSETITDLTISDTTITSSTTIIVSTQNIQNEVDPKIYNIIASDDSIKIDESVIKSKYGLEHIYNTYKGYHIAWRLESVDTGRYIEFNSSDYEYFSSCCTIKAAFALYMCERLEDENCSDTFSTKLYYDRNNPFHTHGGSGDIQKYGSQEYTIKYLLEKCITISDNDAYCVLLEHVGIANFNKWLQSKGSTSLVSTSNVMGYATINSRSIEWNAIIEFCNNDETKSEERTFLWDILTRANSSPIRKGLEKYTSLNASVAHKSGWYNGKSGTSNDCACISLSNGKKYIMIILTEKYNDKYSNDLVESLAANLTRFFPSLD